MKEIPVGNSMVCRVDDEDFPLLSRYRWFLHKRQDRDKFYVHCNQMGGHGHVYMHRLITACPSGMEVDHIDGDGLNNQKLNLRLCRRLHNSRNRLPQVNNSSGQSGVYFHHGRQKWYAQISLQGKRYYIGCFPNLSDAIVARRRVEVAVFGEYTPLLRPNTQCAWCLKEQGKESEISASHGICSRHRDGLIAEALTLKTIVP